MSTLTKDTLEQSPKICVGCMFCTERPPLFCRYYYKKVEDHGYKKPGWCKINRITVVVQEKNKAQDS